MGKTYKDKANYYLHHQEYDSPYAIKKEKHKIAREDIPSNIMPMVEKLEYNYGSANRHGNNRKMYSDMKVIDRRHKRAKDKNDLKEEINNM